MPRPPTAHRHPHSNARQFDLFCDPPYAAPTTTSLGNGRRCVMMSEKIRPHHLERKAILYVRQSSAHQVLHNRESSALQYAMRDRLTALGWSRIDTVDDDLGRSAAGGVARAGGCHG
jgi:16S rRNA G966 N2-methylase RsmD